MSISRNVMWSELQMDHVAWYHLRAFEDSSFAPFAREMTTMVHEERFQRTYAH